MFEEKAILDRGDPVLGDFVTRGHLAHRGEAAKVGRQTTEKPSLRRAQEFGLV